jgi:hypothetical protein
MATFLAEAAKRSGWPRDATPRWARPERHSVSELGRAPERSLRPARWGTGVTRQSLRQRRDTTLADHPQVRKYQSLPISCRRPSRSVQVQALPDLPGGRRALRRDSHRLLTLERSPGAVPATSPRARSTNTPHAMPLARLRPASGSRGGPSDRVEAPSSARQAQPRAPLIRHRDGACRARGEWEVRGDARVDTRFHFRAGIPSLVPWRLCLERRPPARCDGPPTLPQVRGRSGLGCVGLRLPAARRGLDVRGLGCDGLRFRWVRAKAGFGTSAREP